MKYALNERKCLFQIRNNIVSIFNANAETDQIRLYACFKEFLLIHLAVCVARRMEHAASRISYMSHDRDQIGRASCRERV